VVVFAGRFTRRLQDAVCLSPERLDVIAKRDVWLQVIDVFHDERRP
jgi:hypothetical protein